MPAISQHPNVRKGRAEIIQIDPFAIKVGAYDEAHWNPRSTLPDIQELASGMLETLLAGGSITPLIVRNNKGVFELIAGHRRLEAAKHVNVDSMPCVIRRREYPQDEALCEAMTENDHIPLTDIELAKAYARLQAYDKKKWTQDKIAARFGMSQAHVAQKLKLLKASPEVQEAVQSGALTETAARDIVDETKGIEDAQARTEAQVQSIAKPKSKYKKSMALLVAQEVVRAFGSVGEFLSHEGGEEYTEKEEAAWNAGRIAVLCELCGKDADVLDIAEIVSEVQNITE